MIIKAIFSIIIMFSSAFSMDVSICMRTPNPEQCASTMGECEGRGNRILSSYSYDNRSTRSRKAIYNACKEYSNHEVFESICLESCLNGAGLTLGR